MDGRIEIYKKDLQWLKQFQPTLFFYKDSGVNCIKGTLCVKAIYDIKRHEFVINPTENQIKKNGETYIDDCYEVYVKFEPPTHYEIASVWETAGRLKRVAARKGIPLSDLHVYANNGERLCLHGYFNLDDCLPDKNLKDFVSNLLIPFFYGQSIFEKKGEWPFGQYLHSNPGKFQNFLEKNEYVKLQEYFKKDQKLLKRFVGKLTFENNNIRNRHFCICKSGHRIQDCECGLREIINSEDFKPFMKVFREHFRFDSQNENIRRRKRLNRLVTGSKYG